MAQWINNPNNRSVVAHQYSTLWAHAPTASGPLLTGWLAYLTKKQQTISNCEFYVLLLIFKV